MSQFMIFCDDVDENVDISAAMDRKVGVIGGPLSRGTVHDQKIGKQVLQQQPQSRTVLGSLQNAQRIQPQRVAKSSKPLVSVQQQCSTTESQYYKGQNFVDMIGSIKPSVTLMQQPPAPPPSSVPFTIYEDDCDALKKAVGTKPSLAINQGLTANAVNRPVGGLILHTENGHVSPMAVDVDITVHVEPKPGVGAVGDGRLVSKACSKTSRELLIEERLNHILFLPEYRQDIYRNMRETELRYQPRPDYMRRQQDITYSMRTILVDWLVEVAEEYRLNRETLFLAVNYIDRFLSVMAVVRGKLQLVGAAAIFLAAKYEEIYPPDVGEFVYITDDTYTKKQVLQMEKIMLKALAFDVAAPTASWFCQDVLNETDSNEQVTHLSMYLLELALMDGEHFLKYLPSVVATTCVCLANYTLGVNGSMREIMETTGYDSYDLKNCTMDLFYCYHGAAEHPQQSVREKYKLPKYHCVSKIEPPTLPPRVFD